MEGAITLDETERPSFGQKPVSARYCGAYASCGVAGDEALSANRVARTNAYFG